MQRSKLSAPQGNVTHITFPTSSSHERQGQIGGGNGFSELDFVAQVSRYPQQQAGGI